MLGIAVFGLIITIVAVFIVIRNYECKNCRRQKNEKVSVILPTDDEKMEEQESDVIK